MSRVTMEDVAYIKAIAPYWESSRSNGVFTLTMKEEHADHLFTILSKLSEDLEQMQHTAKRSRGNGRGDWIHRWFGV